jgi:signal peptidase I
MSYHGIARTAREVFLTLGAVLGVVCIVVTAAGFAFGVKPLIFRSGSMSPDIHTGDMAISRTVEASALKRGDVVSVVNSGGERVTHRLVNAARQGRARQLTLKGDANKKVDTEVYTVTKAERVLFTIPKAGYVVDAAMSPIGVFVLGLYVAALLVTIFRRGSPPDSESSAGSGGSRRSSRRGKPSRVASRSIAFAVVGSTLMIATPAVATPWVDESPPGATAVLTAATSATIPAPVVSCGLLSIGSARLNWTPMPSATGYVLHYGPGGGTSETVGPGTTSKTFSGLITSGTFTVQAQYGSLPWISPASNSKNYSVFLAALSLCS